MLFTMRRNCTMIRLSLARDLAFPQQALQIFAASPPESVHLCLLIVAKCVNEQMLAARRIVNAISIHDHRLSLLSKTSAATTDIMSTLYIATPRRSRPWNHAPVDLHRPREYLNRNGQRSICPYPPVPRLSTLT